MASRAHRERLRSRVVDLCAALPGVSVEDGRHVGLSVRGKRFAWLLDDHHGDGRLAFTCKAPPGMNTEFADRLRGRYFLPSYTASRGWVGLRLDAGPGGLGGSRTTGRGGLSAAGSETAGCERQRA
jgi:hypothetical protein